MASALVETIESIGETLAPIIKLQYEGSKAAGLTDDRGNPITQEFYVRGVIATIEIGIRKGLLKQ